ncbi:hypothetical protein CSKR_101010 [Clonorchis sinensis]|uniref:G-protein coupled receptors family 1 profile domain-containing protein n=1 Tax=Clonorchis sinensis TaxID=79923 RepID=A0A3R7GM04_CLOSI|nr:hypothetical protein CSKR_101010 [Clonorchis sinensis]
MTSFPSSKFMSFHRKFTVRQFCRALSADEPNVSTPDVNQFCVNPTSVSAQLIVTFNQKANPLSVLLVSSKITVQCRSMANRMEHRQNLSHDPHYYVRLLNGEAALLTADHSIAILIYAPNGIRSGVRWFQVEVLNSVRENPAHKSELLDESEQHNRQGPVCTLDGKYLVEFRFILVVVLTYLLPCVCLVITNVLIAYQLVKLKRRRHILCNTEQKTKQMHLWNASLIPDRQDSACPDSTISTFMERRRTTAQEGRREIGRVVALLILSCLHLCFSLPVSVSLALRASVPNDASQCQRHMYEHLTRLLTSIKDINYALNGFIYTFFFRFYRARLVRILSCGQVDMSKRPVNRIATGHGTAGVSLILNPPENYRRSIISSKCLPTSGCSG